MATTPEGTPYVESSDLVANYPAASLSLANRVDLVGVLPFADSAARATAIPSPTDGQYSYLQDTNTTQFYNGAAWQTAGQTPGMHLVTPTSIANSGGSASASGGAVTFTGVTNVSLNGVFSSTYDNYRVVITSQGSITAQNYLVRYRTAGSDNSTSNYNTTRVDISTGTVSSNFDTGQTSQNIGVTATANDQLIIGEIFRPNLSALTLSNFQNWGTALTNILRLTGGYHNATTVFDGLTLFPATGNITGVIRVYGYQNS